MPEKPTAKMIIKDILSLPVFVAAMGYFVDIYDLILFSIVRVPSLKSIGLQGQSLLDSGIFIINMQMAGMLIGGIIWGILGDKKGRLKILFGSIFLYSIANFLNGMVTGFEQYAALRFLAGIGLAGELGAGVTLVSEILPTHSRGYGTMAIATVGVTGAVLANFVTEQFDWRIAFYIGGALGMALLILRVSVFESGLFNQMKTLNVKKGNFLSLFTDKKKFYKYARSILIGIPIWFVVGILITFSPEFSTVLQVSGTVSAGKAVMFCYIGLVFGDMTSGLASSLLKSRKKIIFTYLILICIFITLYLSIRNISVEQFYMICIALGFSSGYWAIFITVAAEQFGTNIRATVATTVPNFVRGMVVPITLLFQVAKSYLGIIWGAGLIAVICIVIAFTALYTLEETYHKNMDYIET